MKPQIQRAISNSNGINQMNLALKVMEMIGPARFNTEMFFIFLQEMVHNKELIEMKFHHPDYASTQALYFKSGTTIL